MAAPTLQLKGHVSNYENARKALKQYEEKYDLSSPTAIFALSQPQTAQSVLANSGFFFATRTFEKVFNKNVPIEKIKNLALISTLLTQNPVLAQNVFPGIQLTPFHTKEGMQKLQSDLENRTDYQTFKQTGWGEYQNLKATKKLLKQELVSLIDQQHITRASLDQYTKEKRIVKLGFKN